MKRSAPPSRGASGKKSRRTKPARPPGGTSAKKRNPRSPARAPSTRQFLEKIIQSSPDAIVAADMRGRILLFNRGAERISGYRAREVVGRIHVRDLYTPNVAHEIMRRLRSPRFGGRGRLESCVESLRARDGREIPIHISAATIYENGRERATVGVFTDLRDRLRLEKGIRESEALHRAVIEQAHEGIGIAKGGRLIFANRRLRVLLALPETGPSRPSLSRFLDRETQARLGLGAGRGRGEEAPEGAPLEARLQAADGTRRVVEISASPIRYRGADARQIFVRDISARRELEAMYRVLVETATRARQGIILVREDLRAPGAVLFANEEFCRFTGWSLEELQRMNLADLFAPEGLEVASEVYVALLRGDRISPAQRTVLRTRAGAAITVETCTARTTYQGKPAIIGYCRDITEQARLERLLGGQAHALAEKNRELEEAIARLRAARDELQEKQTLAELGTFSAGIAHEIRNPLGLMRSHLHRLQEAKDAAAREAAVRGVERQIGRTSDFIDKILSYARPATPVRRKLDLNRTVSMAARFAAQAFPLPDGVAIERAFDAELPRIQGDHVQLQEVFINLVNNAIQAVGMKGTIRLETGLEADGCVRADVLDTGPGIAEDLAERIFLPFFTSGKGAKGTGMGLAIARRIVEGHGGRIQALRAEGGGMCFRVFLPVAARD
jgi:PAS domain S-box-containing protein